MEAMQKDILLERLKNYNKRGSAAGELIESKRKGLLKGQAEHETDNKVIVQNDQIHFKCLHYSVSESNGYVEITIEKKIPNLEITVGVRTVADTATSPKDYTDIEEIINFTKKDYEKKIKVPIVDDEEWNPDLEFFVELFDPNKPEG